MKTHSSTLRVLKILEYLGKNNDSTIDSITTSIKTPYTTVYRILQTCITSQYVEITRDKRYKLTPKLFQITSTQMQMQTLLISQAHPHLQELSYRTKETVHLAILLGNKVLYIDKIDSQHTLRMYSHIGNESDIYCTGVGKALLAWLSPPVQDTLIESLTFTQHTKNTITSKKSLITHLRKVCKQKYSEDNQEHEEHIHCLAVPVFNKHNHVVAAISVSLPSVRISSKHKELIIKSLWNCGENVSKIIENENYIDCLKGILK